MLNKVVIRYKDGSIKKGHVENFFPNKPFFHLAELAGNHIEVNLESLKAVFFVKDLDGNKDHKKSYNDAVPGGGRKIKVTFSDGETMIGYTIGYSPERKGFFLVPADMKGNNERVFVVKSATETVEMTTQ